MCLLHETSRGSVRNTHCIEEQVRDPPPHDETFAAINAAKATSSEDSLDLDWHFFQESLKRRYLFIEILSQHGLPCCHLRVRQASQL